MTNQQKKIKNKIDSINEQIKETRGGWKDLFLKREELLNELNKLTLKDTYSTCRSDKGSTRVKEDLDFGDFGDM